LQTLYFGLNVIILNNIAIKKALLKAALFLINRGLAFLCNNDNANSNVTKKQLGKNYAEIA
jgi:hypothetical protein